GRLRMIRDAKAEDRSIAEPKGKSGNKADLRYLDRIEPICRIDAITHGTAGEHRGADVVSDRIAGEAGERGDAVRHLVASYGPQREQIIESQREVPACHKKSRRGDMVRLGGLERRNYFVDVDIAEHIEEHDRCDGNDGDAQNQADPIPTDRILEES